MKLLPSVLVLLLLHAAACAQMKWDVPVRGAHVYERVTQRFAVTPPPSKYRPMVAIRGGRAPTPHKWRYFNLSLIHI